MRPHMEEFFKELKKLCTKHRVEIYPGYIDKAETEQGVIVYDENYHEFYSLEDASKHDCKFQKVEDLS